MASWREYQDEVAGFFRSLGLEASTEQRVQGVRAVHVVDVAVRGSRIGLEQLWVVECKRWRRRVDKMHVAALAEIVSDVGADRGLLLSESGFQAGAIQLAQRSQVSLTSLADLRERASGELSSFRFAGSRRRLALLRRRVAALHKTGGDRIGNVIHLRPGVNTTALIRLHAALSSAGDGLSRADSDEWPTPYGWDFSRDELLVALTPEELTIGLRTVLDEAERVLNEQEDAIAACTKATAEGAHADLSQRRRD